MKLNYSIPIAGITDSGEITIINQTVTVTQQQALQIERRYQSTIDGNVYTNQQLLNSFKLRTHAIETP